MDLRPDQLRMSRDHRRLHAGELCRGQQQHVVRGCRELRADRGADLLKQRVGGGQIHDSGDRDAIVAAAGQAEDDRAPGRRVEVGSRLLGEYRSVEAPGQQSELAGKRGRVARRQAQNLGGTRRLRETLSGGGHRGCSREGDRQRLRDPREVLDSRGDRGRVRAWLCLNLPVDRDPGDRPPRHPGVGGRQEGADRSDQGDADGDADDGGEDPGGTVRDQSSHPAQGDHAFSVSRTASSPLWISQRPGRASAIARS